MSGVPGLSERGRPGGSPPGSCSAACTGQELVIDGGQTLNALSVTSSVVRQDSMS